MNIPPGLKDIRIDKAVYYFTFIYIYSIIKLFKKKGLLIGYTP